MMHPARKLSYSELCDGLESAKASGLVNEQASDDGLRLFCYSRSCVYDRQWDDITLMARGLILDAKNERIAATPFPKFFNVGERADTIPDLSFETFEKVDGSLVILFHHAGEWRTATKGSLASDQAKWAASRLGDTASLDKETTYLLEAVYPENRIVVHYDREELVLLGAYDGGGSELGYDNLQEIGPRAGWRVAERHGYGAVSELLAEAKILPASKEGFVLRFANGLRLKVKGEEYCRIHSLISRVTPLAMWEAMFAGDDLETLRRELPEEFWPDFDQITRLLREQIDDLAGRAKREAVAVAHLSDKEVGLRLNEFPDDVRRFIFPYRRNDGDLMSGKPRQFLFRQVRPTGNQLKSYVPSYAMGRVLEAF